MDLGLHDKIVLITGASSGIGAAAAQIFSAGGADVVISYGKNTPGAEMTAQMVRTNGRRAWLCPMDVSDPDSVNTAVRALSPEIPGLDVLVSCAGLSLHTEFAAITPNEWQCVLAINLNGPFYVLQACTPLLRDGGSVVLVSSVSHQAHYAAAKAGLVNLTVKRLGSISPAGV